MKAIIIEDEKNAQEALVNMLNLIDKNLKILGIAEEVGDAVKLINENRPDVVFLDIHLKNGTGFDVLEQLIDFKGTIVFTTAYENYAIKAFRYSAFDYILKPINPLELKKTISELDKEFNKNKKYEQMLKVYKQSNIPDEEAKIVLKTLNNQYIINIKNIIRCESEGAYTKFFLKDKTYLTSKNLKYYDEILSEHDFIRTHQSHLVNAQYILRLNSNNFVELKDNSQVPVSARKKTFVNKKIKSLNL